MTVPPEVRQAVGKVSDMVRDLFGKGRHVSDPNMERIAIYLRGNENLYEGLRAMIQSRIEQRASVPEPADPVLCKSMLARDRELQWLLSRLESIYRSPVVKETDDDGEQPAA